MSDEKFGPYDFALTKDEFVAYAQEVARRQMAQLDAKSWRLAIFAFLAVIAVLGGLAASGVADGATLTTGLLASAGAILIGGFMIRRQIARSQHMAIAALAKEGEAYGQPVRLALDAAGLTIEMRGGRDARPFAELREAGRVGGLITFWSGPNDGVALPERVLGGAQEGETILAFVRARMAS
jgi:hypothetical protein